MCLVKIFLMMIWNVIIGKSVFSKLLFRPIPELDVYEADGLANDDEDLSELSPTARAEAEHLMRQRDREAALATGGLRRDLIAGKWY